MKIVKGSRSKSESGYTITPIASYLSSGLDFIVGKGVLNYVEIRELWREGGNTPDLTN